MAPTLQPPRLSQPTNGRSSSEDSHLYSPSDPMHPSSLLHQRAHDGLLDPSRSTVVTPDGSQNTSPTRSASPSPLNGNGDGRERRGTLSKGWKGRGRDWGAGQGEEDDLEQGETTGLMINTELADDNEGWASGRRADSQSEMNGDGPGGGLSIRIERPSTPQISSNSLLRPTFPPPPSPRYPPSSTGLVGLYRSLRASFSLFALQTGSLAISTLFLGGVVFFALVNKFLFTTLPRLVWPRPPQVFAWDDPEKWKKEKIINDPAYYARNAGVELEDIVVESEDGFYLKLQKVIVPGAPVLSDGRGGFPVLLMHGLFQSAGSFITSEERSLAFWLAREGGYQVYLGNTRGVFDMGHKTFSRGDPRFWDWTIRELSMYDLPALVDAVVAQTGYSKIGFIGHSQGNGTAFVSLSLGIRPDLGTKLTCFIALAPAVFAGPLTHGFPFTVLGRMEWRSWRRVFGVLDFIPIMSWAYNWAPQAAFASLGYTMFASLFDWTDANWLLRRKGKMFRFTPSPVSSASIFWWAGKGGFATRKCLFDVGLDKWFDDRFPPLSIYYGGRDYLVLTEPLLDRLAEKEKEVKVIRVKKLDLSEHCDFFWAAEAVEWCYHDILHDIESTRTRYPEEDDDDARVNGDGNGHTGADGQAQKGLLLDI